MAGERTEQASPQRREKARKEGDLVHSRELCSAAGTVAGVMLLGLAAPRFLNLWTKSLKSFLGYGAVALWEPEAVDQTMRALLGLAMRVLAPVGLVAAAVTAGALAAGILQTGGIQIHPQVLSLKLDRINPVSNLSSLFSLRSTARLAKSMVPAAILAIFAVQRIARQWDMPPFSSVRLVALGMDVYQLLLAASWLLFAWAAIDYLVEWRSREQRLRMSRQEMREEYKESEGNPQIRGRIRNLQRQARRRRMKADVTRAAVVITNPTHYAVALDFDFGTMEAPKVLAKGRNLLAEEIKDQARWAGVPILENPPLARSLYRSVEPGEPIPVALYAAVASILAFLYRQRVEDEMRYRRERAAGSKPDGSGPHRSPPEGAAPQRPGAMAVIRGIERSRPTRASASTGKRQERPLETLTDDRTGAGVNSGIDSRSDSGTAPGPGPSTSPSESSPPASHDGASHDGASLNGASLNGVSLDTASLDGSRRAQSTGSVMTGSVMMGSAQPGLAVPLLALPIPKARRPQRDKSILKEMQFERFRSHPIAARWRAARFGRHLESAARISSPSRSDQRDLCHAGAAAGGGA